MGASLEHALNLVWVLLAGFLVMFMQAGFAMVETGFTRAKNAVNTMAMNFIIYPLGVLGFWLCGYGLMLGGVGEWPSVAVAARGLPAPREIGVTLGGHLWGLVGASKFALVSVPNHAPSLAMFLFAAVFIRSAGSSRRSFATACSCRWFSTPFTATGSGEAGGWPRSASARASGMAMSTSRARRSCT